MTEDVLKPGRDILHVRLLYEVVQLVGEAALQDALDARLAGAEVTPRDARGVVGIRGPATL
jgi:hypothetical protein